MIKLELCEFQVKQILSPINFTFSKGLYALLGRNGIGKSTLFKALAAELAYKGSACLNDVELSSLSVEDRAKKLAYISQSFEPYYAFSVKEFIDFGARFSNVDSEECAKECGCYHLLNRPITKLSGGQLALVRLAAAIASKAQIYLLDEPLAALDLSASAKLMQVLQNLSKEACVIYSCHDANAARGKICALSPAKYGAKFSLHESTEANFLKDLYECEIICKNGFFSY